MEQEEQAKLEIRVGRGWSIVDQDEGEQDKIKFRVQEKMEKM